MTHYATASALIRALENEDTHGGGWYDESDAVLYGLSAAYGLTPYEVQREILDAAGALDRIIVEFLSA